MEVARDDVLRALKRCRRLAKQDLLASDSTSDPEFWKTQAESRRATYTELAERIRRSGVDAAYQFALARYAALPSFRVQDHPDPNETGRRQALEMFFTILGVGKNNLKASLNDLPSVVAAEA